MDNFSSEDIKDQGSVVENEKDINSANELEENEIELKDNNVKGIIIAGKYDKKLDYALEYAPFETDVFIYNVSFTLNEFKKWKN